MEEEHEEHKTEEETHKAEETSHAKQRKTFSEWYDKHYKLLLLIPALILLFGIIHMSIFYSQNNDFVLKDVSLTGGTTITVQDAIDPEALQTALENTLADLTTRQIFDPITGQQKGIIIETTDDLELARGTLEDYLGYDLNSSNASFEFTGSTLSDSFYKQLLIAILFAFVLMALVVFFLFRSFVPSAAVIISAIADIFMTLVLVNFLGIKMSSAGIVAFLMLIGYSVDTDILLTNRVLKRRSSGDTTNAKIFSAFKTGITMTLTSLFGILVALFIVRSFSIVLTQIFTVLVIGLSFDLINTWTTNASILKWYTEVQAKK